MIKFVIFDTDGMVVHRKMRFSQRFSEEFNIPKEKILTFFENEFQPCLIGKADLKNEIQKYLIEWKWNKSTEEFLQYWFESENNISKEIIEIAQRLRADGIKCFLSTNNEKYRVDYLFNRLGLNKYFDGIFYSAKIEYMKQDERFWQEVLKQLKTSDKKSVLCWDDEQRKLEAAKKFGFITELYTNLNEFKNKIKKYTKIKNNKI